MASSVLRDCGTERRRRRDSDATSGAGAAASWGSLTPVTSRTWFWFSGVVFLFVCHLCASLQLGLQSVCASASRDSFEVCHHPKQTHRCWWLFSRRAVGLIVGSLHWLQGQMCVVSRPLTAVAASRNCFVDEPSWTNQKGAHWTHFPSLQIISGFQNERCWCWFDDGISPESCSPAAAWHKGPDPRWDWYLPYC